MIKLVFHLHKCWVLFLLGQLAGLSTLFAQSDLIWYAQPATKWNAALPEGNGRLAAMIYGGVADETIALGEISLWSGGPDSTSNQLCGPEALAEMRKAFFENRPTDGNQLGNRYLTGRMTTFGTHLPLGDLKIRFANHEGYAADYRRELDMETGLSYVTYRIGDVRYKRSYFVSYPDNVIAIRIEADQPYALSANLAFDLLRKAEVTPASNNALQLQGKVDFPMHGPGGVDFYAQARVETDGGKVSCQSDTLYIKEANTATVYLDIRTNYMHDDFEERCRRTLAAAENLGFEKLKQRHIDDHSALYNRMSITLGESSAQTSLPTDVRLHNIQQGATDAAFDALFFQYGRYMLIASSRKHDLPLCANLQGIWNDNLACNMPWTCDYHLDINIEQNYWAANRVNLPMCNEPLFAYLRLLEKNGSETARRMYGCDGWVAHTVCNAWGYTAPGWGVSWGMNVTGGAWLATHLWSHFLYTRDMDYLRNTGYPLLKSTAEFFVDYMVEDPRTGYLVTGPSISPENGYIAPDGNHLSLDMMPTVDRDVVYDIYQACIKSSELLGVDREFRKRLERDIKRLPPLQIGSDGQVQEWLSDVKRSDPAHRHSSHLLALFPLGQISYTKDPELIAASEKGLKIQTASPTWEDTEWSTANMLCFYARMKKAEEAHGWLQNLFHRFTRENLMTVSPAGVAMAESDIFSFDATEGSVAGMCEMLLQSYDGFVELLPALPAAWKDGSVRGLCAEGGMIVDLGWKNGEVTEVTFYATENCNFRLKGYNGNVRMKKGENIRFYCDNGKYKK